MTRMNGMARMNGMTRVDRGASRLSGSGFECRAIVAEAPVKFKPCHARQSTTAKGFPEVGETGRVGRGLIDNVWRAHYVQTGRKGLQIRDDTGLLSAGRVWA